MRIQPARYESVKAIGSRRGFTLIELVMVVLILSALSVVAIPMALSYSIDAKKSACKGALGGMRSAIENFTIWSLTAAGGGAKRPPSIAELTTPGTVLHEAILPNPFDKDGTPNNIVDATGRSKGTIMGSSGGWCYNPTTGDIWANTLTKYVVESTY